MDLKRWLRGLGLVLIALSFWQCARKDYLTLIEEGDYKRAAKIISERLEDDHHLSPERRLELQFELERMERIRQDFQRSEQEVLDYVRQYLPQASAKDLARYEKSGTLEAMVIDGKKYYFNYAAQNLFRLDPELKAIKQKSDSLAGKNRGEKFDLDGHCRQVIDEAVRTGQRFVSPVTMRIKQSITVPPNVVPAHKVIRCWIPYPREIPQRQVVIQLLSTDPKTYIIAPNDLTLQRTIYFEKVALPDSATHFSVEYTYRSYAVYAPIEAEKVLPTPERSDLKPYLEEQPPHIVFTPAIRALSQAIVGSETNPYRIAQKLFAWVDENIPWASAREYSTFYNIPDYVLKNRHGDCGMQTLTFITLCRLNGIPARWQSGWEFQPPDDSMHDWGEIYFEPYGWLPMDVTYGQRPTTDERLRWFYLNGMDSYRLIFNDGISARFFPAKVHFRSETVDSQRGEVEWEGGNLYYDQWDWDIEWEVLQK